MIQLCMILRDEAHAIEPTLKSVAPYVARYTVLDTGSTDGTPELVERYMRAARVPGAVHHGAFTDYADTRNRCLALAGDSEPWLLMLDAEDELMRGPSLSALLGTTRYDCCALVQRWPEGEVIVPRVVRAGSSWRYVGAVHELLTHPTGRPPQLLVGPWIRHRPTELGRARSRARWPRDVELLRAQLAEDPGDHRARWHLERTLAALAALHREEQPCC
jgi:glycosyltransferase involved in cell wall biosynthesis